MDLRRLEIFVKVAELGSFSRAAQALALTQPTVSEHVRALEDELGTQLLDRLGRGAAPTRAGQLLFGYAQRMLTLAREAHQALERALSAADTSLAAFRIVGEMGSTEAVKQGVRAGVGVALISKRAVEDECRAGLVSCVKVTTMPVARAFYLVTNRERSRSPLALAFLTFLESQFPAAAS